MPARRKYPLELPERALRLVQEAREQEPELSVNTAVMRIGTRVGANPDTLRGWVKQADTDTDKRPAGMTSSDAARIKELGRENLELKRANENLLAAWRFFAWEFDLRLP